MRIAVTTFVFTRTRIGRHEKRLSKEDDDAGAQRNLGFMYYKGQGVPLNYVRAHMWFNLSAAQGDQAAVKSRDLVAQLITPAQIAEAQKLARE
jgi:uncharacterized protein